MLSHVVSRYGLQPSCDKGSSSGRMNILISGCFCPFRNTFPIPRLTYCLLQMKISPNYECKRGITRKLAINKRLLRSTQAAKSPPRHRSDSSIRHKKGGPPLSQTQWKKRARPEKAIAKLGSSCAHLPAHAQHFGQHPGSNQRMGVTELKVLMSSYLWIVENVS